MIQSDKERAKRWVENYDKPLSPPRPAPKPASSKKKGRKSQQQDNEETTTE